MCRTQRERRQRETREAICLAAKELFIERGFDATGIRDIAARANVNPAIVIRHFGSKEHLFTLVVNAREAWDAFFLNVPLLEIGRHVVREILENRDEGVRIFAVLLQASGRPEVREHIHQAVHESVEGLLVPHMSRPDARLRAHLFVAQLLGLLTALTLYGDEQLWKGDPEQIIERYGAGLQCLLTG